MLKKISCVLTILAVFFSFLPSISSAEVLSWQPVVDETHGLGAGFGDPANQFVMSMATFNDYIYVGTYNNIGGTEVWRSRDGITWSQANTNNFGRPATLSLSNLVTFGGYLYAIYSEQNMSSAYRTLDGTNWDLVKANIGSNDGVVISAFTSVTTFNNLLYAGGLNSDGEAIVFSTTNGGVWHQINVDNFGDVNNGPVQAISSYNGKLYVGVYNDVNGAEVWAYNGTNWGLTPDNLNGFDGTIDNLTIASLNEFNGQLYATTDNDTTGTEVWRTLGDGTWARVANAGFNQGAAVNNTFNSIVFQGNLYVGAQGARIFRTSDGTTWEQVNWTGFGNANNDLVAFGILGDYVYVGTGNINLQAQTVRIYRYGIPTPAPIVEVLPETGANL